MTRILIVAAGIAGCVASGAAAQEIVFDTAQTEACLAAAEDPAGREACIGASAKACMEATSDGWTTVGTATCLSYERDYWDARLNAAYGALMESEAATDAEMRELGASEPSRADALREMQRAWIPFRDARCMYERSQWGSGTGGGPAFVSCAMQVTGQQALLLEAMENRM